MSSGLQLTQITAEYMKMRYQQQSTQSRTAISIPAGLTPSFALECDHAVSVIIQARNNSISTGWSVSTYINHLTPCCTGMNLPLEDNLKRLFPPIHTPTAYNNQPCVVSDIDGNLLLWYMPDLFAPERKEQMWAAMTVISPGLRVERGNNWRHGTQYYHDSPKVKAGTVTMSPAWSQQGHHNVNRLEVSLSLTGEASRRWLEHQIEASALVGGVMSIIHPELYEAGVAALNTIFENPRTIHKGEHLQSLRRSWTSPFGVMSLISNHNTPYHRDNRGDHGWYDVLVPLGEYEEGRIEFPGLGMRLAYEPGCLVAFASRVLRHGVNCPPERVVVAHYMKSTVLRSLGIPSPTWAKLPEHHQSS